LAGLDVNRVAAGSRFTSCTNRLTRHLTVRLATTGNGKHAKALATSEVRRILEQACARQDILACARRDLGAIIGALGAHGLKQGQITDMTGIHQGRPSEYMIGKRSAQASTTFENFADGLGPRHGTRTRPGPLRRAGLASTICGNRCPTRATYWQVTAVVLATGLEAPQVTA
jgi:hypothetical protein